MKNQQYRCRIFFVEVVSAFAWGNRQLDGTKRKKRND